MSRTDQEMSSQQVGTGCLAHFYVFGLTAALEDDGGSVPPLLPAWHLSTASASPDSHFLGHWCGTDS